MVYEDKFNYGGTRGTIQIPLGSRWWLLLRGGGGVMGTFHGGGGLRIRLKGNGNAGSLFLAATLGWGMVYDNVKTSAGYGQRKEYHGPMASIGIEWRR